jgi:hypothetical protein
MCSLPTGTSEAVETALHALQHQFFPEIMRNTQLYIELFERSARPALTRVRYAICVKRRTRIQCSFGSKG